MKGLFATFLLWTITSYGYDCQKATVATDFSWNNNRHLLSGDSMLSVPSHRTTCENPEALVLAARNPLVNTSSPPVRFSEHLIADKYAYAYGITAADFDNDGDMDLSSGDCNPHNMLYLFQNDAHGSFTRSFVQKNDPERLERHMAGDVDNDGDLDIVIVKNLHGDLVWFENGAIPSSKQWNRHVITVDLPGAYDVALADFDRDGDLDVAASSWRLGNQFAWFENDGTPKNGEWTKHMIEKQLSETRTIRAADFDQDGEKHVIHPMFDDAFEAIAGDLDGDGDMDVAATSWRLPGRVAWFENKGDSRGPWKYHLLKENWRSANQILLADINGDGRLDIVACAERGSNELRWWRNEGR